MTEFLLDTNVVSELRKPLPHGAVVAWYRAMTADRLCLPAIAFYELQSGVELTRRQDPVKAAEIERWINELPRRMTVVSFSAEAARETARMMRGKAAHLTEDAMIAAIAKVNGFTVATRNLRDFALFDVAVVNPFDYKG